LLRHIVHSDDRRRLAYHLHHRMSDTIPTSNPAPAAIHRSLRRGVIAALILMAAGPIVLRWLGTEMPRGLIFRLILLSTALCTIIGWASADEILLRRPRSRGARAALRTVLAAFTLLVTVPVVHMLWSGRIVGLLKVPVWAGGGLQLWHMGLGIGVPIVVMVVL